MKTINSDNFPPKIFKRYGGEFLEVVEGVKCTVSFDVKEEDFNPLGITLGGVYAIYFDMTMGPFSYISTKKACTSLDLNIDFLKSLGAQDKKITVTAHLVHRSTNYLLFSAEAFNVNGDLIATAKSRMKILG